MMLAIALVNTSPAEMENVLQKTCKIDGVKEAYMLYGIYDIIALVEANTIEKLKEIVLHIRMVKYVLSTLTLIVVR